MNILFGYSYESISIVYTKVEMLDYRHRKTLELNCSKLLSSKLHNLLLGHEMYCFLYNPNDA